MQADAELEAILAGLANGQELTTAEGDRLVHLLRATPPEWEAFHIPADGLEAAVQARVQLFSRVYPALEALCRDQLQWTTVPLSLLWRVWLPLALALAAQRQRMERPLIHGLLGVQGTGKTTLTAILSLILPHLGYQVCCISLDDLYLTYRDRQLLQQADPRLRWRGPPGTHEVGLGITVLQYLRRGDFPVSVHRFDKSALGGAGDRTTPEVISHTDIVLFEGWFVGVRPLDPAVFETAETAPPPILTEGDRTFARDCNARLHDYVPLWDLLDGLTVLYPTDYRYSQQWRQQAEEQMIATGRSGMNSQELQQFVAYFWRSLHPALFLPPLLGDGDRVDRVIEVHPDRTLGAIYHPPKPPQKP